MKINSVYAFIVALLVVGVVVPTGAVSPADQLLAEPSVVLTPSNGPNGDYVAVSGGELSVDLATIGINPNALTTIRDVFTISNRDSEPVRVWIEHEATEVVTFEGKGEGSIQGADHDVRLEPGETLSVSLVIDTDGIGNAPSPVLEEFEVHVAQAAEEPVQPTAGGIAGAPIDHTLESIRPAEGVEVDFEDGVDGRVVAREVPLEALTGDGAGTRSPEAVIHVLRGDAKEATSPPTQTVVGVGENVALSGEASRFGSARSIDREERLIRAVDVTVPTDIRATPATIRIWVDETEVGDTSTLRIGRFTADGWQLLPTTVIGHEGGQYILEADTSGLGRFVVFRSPDVQYRWQSNTRASTGERLHLATEDPTIHDVTLSVIDSLGQSTSVSHRVVVNDEPTARIEVPTNRSPGEPFTLRANVSNEVGNVTVTWTFTDGTQLTGMEVRRAFDSGEHVVRVTVEDEFGASTTVERSIQVGPVSPARVVVNELAKLSEFTQVLWLTVILLLLLLILGRVRANRQSIVSLLPSIRVPIPIPAAIRGTPPRIVELERPAVDMTNLRFEIGRLKIEDPDGDLDNVEIIVTDSQGTEAARQQLDLRGRTQFTSTNLAIIPKSRDHIRSQEGYTFEVRAGDTAGRWTGRQLALKRPTAIA